MYAPDTTLADHKRALPIVGAIDGHDHRANPEASQHLLGIARSFRKTEPKHVDGRAQVLHHETGCRAHRRGTAVAAHDQVGANFERTVRRRHFDADHPARVLDQTCYLRRHHELQGRKAPALVGQEVEEVPLRHQGNELAWRRNMREFRDLETGISDLDRQRPDFRVRQLQKVIYQPQLLHYHDSSAIHLYTLTVHDALPRHGVR